MPDDTPTRVNLTDGEPEGGWRWPTRDQDHGKRSTKSGKYDNSTKTMKRTLDGLRRL